MKTPPLCLAVPTSESPPSKLAVTGEAKSPEYGLKGPIRMYDVFGETES